MYRDADVRQYTMRPWLRALARSLCALAEAMEQLAPLLLDGDELAPRRRGADISPDERAALTSMISSLRWVSEQGGRLADALEASTIQTPVTPSSSAATAPAPPPDRVPMTRPPWAPR